MTYKNSLKKAISKYMPNFKVKHGFINWLANELNIYHNKGIKYDFKRSNRIY